MILIGVFKTVAIWDYFPFLKIHSIARWFGSPKRLRQIGVFLFLGFPCKMDCAVIDEVGKS